MTDATVRSEQPARAGQPTRANTPAEPSPRAATMAKQSKQAKQATPGEQAKQGKSNGEPGPDVLFAQVEADRQQLADTLDTLLARAAPAAVADRTKHRVTGYFVTPDGHPRTESILRVGAVAGGVVGGVVALWLLRRRFHR